MKTAIQDLIDANEKQMWGLPKGFLKELLEKEKHQIIDFFVEGCNTMSCLKYGGIDDFNIWAERHYNETFKK